LFQLFQQKSALHPPIVQSFSLFDLLSKVAIGSPLYPVEHEPRAYDHRDNVQEQIVALLKEYAHLSSPREALVGTPFKVSMERHGGQKEQETI
jgi:hypothetical protein